MENSLPAGSMHEVLVVGNPKYMETCYTVGLLKDKNIPYKLYNPSVEPNSEEYVKSLHQQFGMTYSEFVVLSGKFLTSYSTLERKERKKQLIEYLTSADPQNSGDNEAVGEGEQDCYEEEGEGGE
uniref:Uncharacterized protein n=1 Tax=Euplotes harpa TaxID=151035 RepID=A0A7S3J8J5_9SPIT|mmetsp:Transcript_25927/g.29933  ORF Transcript_25927/g.29933 Transcript_25927/m.29933 type:complete len:125 (+) Transcript_25927:12-386(+)